MKRLKRPISFFGSLNKWEIAQTEGGLQRQILRSIERLAAALPEDAPMTISREDFDPDGGRRRNRDKLGRS